jgi:hypothetical protein
MASKSTSGEYRAWHRGSPTLLLGRDAAELINARLASRDWWLFVVCERTGIAFAKHIENTYFAGEANKDFELVVAPALEEGFGIVAFLLAKKSRLPYERLRGELSNAAAAPDGGERVHDQDILFLHPESHVAAALADFVQDYLSPRARLEAN